MLVNDKHSRLNSTNVKTILNPADSDELCRVVKTAAAKGETISVSGGRHAMGGQQFGTESVLVDMRQMKRIVNLDTERGICEVEAGIQWPELIDVLHTMQNGALHPWTIAQKQTGAIALTIGGALASNIHGRGLSMSPIVNDVESFEIVTAEGELTRCSRDENRELFGLAIGGYGLFGIIASVKLRLVPRIMLQRIVEVRQIDGLMDALVDRIGSGFLYGDFQYATDSRSNDFLRKGVFSSYKPVDSGLTIPEDRIHLTEADWQRLVYLAHASKTEAFVTYANHYLSTSGQLYWSDLHQLAVYLEEYHTDVDRKLGSAVAGSEVITEIYVPRDQLTDFMNEVREDFRRQNVDLIYGTIRLVEKDVDTYLTWATQPWACVIFNLHVTHSLEGRSAAADAFSRLTDMAISRNGSFYLTYHRHGTRSQVEACYPMFSEFLRLKLKYDPTELFQSDWYRHYRDLFRVA
jgi:FAD/FMN-containing dehydrogenase